MGGGEGRSSERRGLAYSLSEEVMFHQTRCLEGAACVMELARNVSPSRPPYVLMALASRKSNDKQRFSGRNPGARGSSQCPSA